MRASTFFFNGQITMSGLQNMIAVEKDVANAVRELGYDPDKQNLRIEAVAYNRYSVYFGRSYVGIWDGQRKTFVD